MKKSRIYTVPLDSDFHLMLKGLEEDLESNERIVSFSPVESLGVAVVVIEKCSCEKKSILKG